MDQMFEFGTEEFIRYEKNHGEKPTRNEKKQAKLQKLRADLQDPQQKKKRYDLRRKLYKEKLQKQLQGMNEEQVKEYLDEKSKKKKEIKEKCKKGLETGMPILIDLVYEHKMNPKQNKSLAMQIQLITKVIKHIDDPPGIHLCSVQGGIKKQLEKMRYNYWTLTSSEDDVLQVAKKMGKKLVYLSPDSPNELQKIQEDAAYVIGGLVDRTVIKNASLTRAQDLGIPAVRLPISQFMKNRKCLNLDHVVMIMSKYKECGNWKEAFDFGAPKRWKKDEEKESSEEQQQQKKQQQILGHQKQEQNDN